MVGLVGRGVGIVGFVGWGGVIVGWGRGCGRGRLRGWGYYKWRGGGGR